MRQTRVWLRRQTLVLTHQRQGQQVPLQTRVLMLHQTQRLHLMLVLLQRLVLRQMQGLMQGHQMRLQVQGCQTRVLSSS